MILFLSAVFASSTPQLSPPEVPPLDCETPARWKLFDESVLDLQPPAGTEGLPITVACRFLGVPGAVVDVGDEPDLHGLKVIGIRRAQGQVVVAATPAQAEQIRRLQPRPAFTLVRDGSWRPLIEALEGIH